jgi:hypothetical protein
MPLPMGEGLSEPLSIGYACRNLQPKTFGRGFDSRRLHCCNYAATSCFHKGLRHFHLPVGPENPSLLKHLTFAHLACILHQPAFPAPDVYLR